MLECLRVVWVLWGWVVVLVLCCLGGVGWFVVFVLFGVCGFVLRCFVGFVWETCGFVT